MAMAGNAGPGWNLSAAKSAQEQIGHRTDADERLWGMLAHLLALASCILAGLSFIGPLVVYILKHRQSPFIAHHAREALNFHLSLLVYTATTVALAWLISDYLAILTVGVAVFGVAATARNALLAHRGEWVRYPLSLKFLP
jgi:uncharacterized Tic20 family protein